MLYVQSRRGNGWSYPPTLSENTHFAAVDFFFIWCTMDDALLNERDALKIALLCWEKKTYFGIFGAKRIGEPLKIIKAWTK